MAETLYDFGGLEKPEAYARADVALDALLDTNTDVIAAMSTMSALLHHGFGFLWTGFYRLVAPDLLRVGPYQGTIGCLEIAVGRGVCGTAAARRETVIVRDVAAFPGHIACDARSRSEIVVPVFDEMRRLIAVLDIDSDRVNAFDADDREGLERMVSRFAVRRAGERSSPQSQ